MQNQLRLAIIVTILIYGNCWHNSYDGELNFICPDNTVVSGILSQHHNFYEDRQFHILCRYTTGIRSRCYWSGWVNDFDQFFAYQCYHHGFIHGMRSVHSNYNEDRRWEFYCCEHNGLTVSECFYTRKNYWDAYFSVYIPENSVMRGVTSVHNNYFEDRQYVFELCKLKQL